MTEPNADPLDVIVVGAGAAGIGIGVACSKLDLDVRILDRDGIGAAFEAWPDEMRMLTPSFPSGDVGLPDLNAITPRTSPALALDREHPSGAEYAEYLRRIAAHYELRVETGVEVQDVHTSTEAATDVAVAVDGGTAAFTVETSDGPLSARNVIWAAGEFGSPNRTPFQGADHGVHNAAVDSWAGFWDRQPDDECFVVGGDESGIDAATALVDAGASVTVLDPGAPWAFRSPDPSQSLSPYTIERLEAATDSGQLDLVAGARVEGIDGTDGRYELQIAEVPVPTPEGEHPGARPEGSYETTATPVLATGFEPVLGPIEGHVPREDGRLSLTDRDESPSTPGLFFAGPAVSHEGIDFCFIYEFRTRFAVVAETIADRLGVDTEPLDVYREENMYLEDPSCCDPDICDC